MTSAEVSQRLPTQPSFSKAEAQQESPESGQDMNGLNVKFGSVLGRTPTCACWLKAIERNEFRKYDRRSDCRYGSPAQCHNPRVLQDAVFLRNLSSVIVDILVGA